MTTRVLPFDEWPRLAGTELEHAWPHLRPADASIVVVEDPHGQIVACHALIRYLHVEGLWVHPDHRKSLVGGRLWQAVRREAIAHGAAAVLTSAVSDDVGALIQHVGGVPLPGVPFVIPIRGGN